jgi:hypothetical protein
MDSTFPKEIMLWLKWTIARKQPSSVRLYKIL